MQKPVELAQAELIEGIARRYGTTPWDVAQNAPMWLLRHMAVLSAAGKRTDGV